jgi:hypothetical protein
MRAKVGDWLVVESAETDRPVRRALITEVGGPDGTPPFHVRWLDDDHEGVVFPGPDAHVVDAQRQHELDARTGTRMDAVRRELAASKPPAG